MKRRRIGSATIGINIVQLQHLIYAYSAIDRLNSQLFTIRVIRTEGDCQCTRNSRTSRLAGAVKTRLWSWTYQKYVKRIRKFIKALHARRYVEACSLGARYSLDYISEKFKDWNRACSITISSQLYNISVNKFRVGPLNEMNLFSECVTINCGQLCDCGHSMNSPYLRN